MTDRDLLAIMDLQDVLVFKEHVAIFLVQEGTASNQGHTKLLKLLHLLTASEVISGGNRITELQPHSVEHVGIGLHDESEIRHYIWVFDGAVYEFSAIDAFIDVDESESSLLGFFLSFFLLDGCISTPRILWLLVLSRGMFIDKVRCELKPVRENGVTCRWFRESA